MHIVCAPSLNFVCARVHVTLKVCHQRCRVSAVEFIGRSAFWSLSVAVLNVLCALHVQQTLFLEMCRCGRAGVPTCSAYV